MPNQRQPGTKLAGAYISAEKDNALAEIAALKGHANKAEFIRSFLMRQSRRMLTCSKNGMIVLRGPI
jgi:hypothetical protein